MKLKFELNVRTYFSLNLRSLIQYLGFARYGVNLLIYVEPPCQNSGPVPCTFTHRLFMELWATP